MAHECKYFMYDDKGILRCTECGCMSDRPIMASEVVTEKPEIKAEVEPEPEIITPVETEAEEKAEEKADKKKGKIVPSGITSIGRKKRR